MSTLFCEQWCTAWKLLRAATMRNVILTSCKNAMKLLERDTVAGQRFYLLAFNDFRSSPDNTNTLQKTTVKFCELQYTCTLQSYTKNELKDNEIIVVAILFFVLWNLHNCVNLTIYFLPSVQVMKLVLAWKPLMCSLTTKDLRQISWNLPHNTKQDGLKHTVAKTRLLNICHKMSRITWSKLTNGSNYVYRRGDSACHEGPQVFISLYSALKRLGKSWIKKRQSTPWFVHYRHNCVKKKKLNIKNKCGR